MKKIIITSCMAISLMGLTACSSSEPSPSTVTITQQAPVPNQDDPSANSMSNEDLYILALRAMNNPILNIATDNELISMGSSVCEAMSAGFSTDEIISYMAVQMAGQGMTSDTEVEAVGYIIGAAESALCPMASF